MSEVEENLEEQEANPYNAKKSWHKPDGPQTQSADSLFYEGQATPQQEAPDEDEQDAPPKRKRANYKKRYDDLKKHYDDRVSQFKQREQELLAEARASQPKYEAPKSIEDLEKFREAYPDLYETVETVAHLQSERQLEDLQGQLSAIQQREADIMRRAMGKKKKSLMAELSVKFVAGAEEKGIRKKKAEEIFSLIEKFAQYGFNKSHSTAYAYVAYQTAWLKTHYTAEFMSANLTSEMGSINRVVILINECKYKFF